MIHTFPLFTKCTKDIIISILHQQYPLKVRDIHKLSKKQNHFVARTTIHENLRDLQNKNIVIKNEDGYQLHSEWIQEMKAFSDGLHTELPSFYGYPSSPLGEVMEFSSLEEMDIFYHHFKTKFIEESKGEGDDVIVWLGNHIRWKLLSLGKNTRLTREAIKRKIKILIAVRGNSPLDKLSESLYKNLGVEIKTGADLIIGKDVGIFNDIMLLFHHHPDTRRAIEKMYAEIDSIEDINTTDYFNLYTEKRKQYLLVINNKGFIDFYKDYMNTIFTENAIA